MVISRKMNKKVTVRLELVLGHIYLLLLQGKDRGSKWRAILGLAFLLHRVSLVDAREEEAHSTHRLRGDLLTLQYSANDNYFMAGSTSS